MELYKTRNNISSHIMNELFEQRNIIYNLQSQTDFTTGPISTVNNGLKSLRYLEPDIRNSGKLSVGLLKIVIARYVLITYITMGMSISHIFGTSPSEVLWQIERVPTLAGDLTMAASALKIYS